MGIILLIHVVAGGCGLASGYLALYAAKGAPLHRQSGRLFVFVMLTMSVTGMWISAAGGVAPAINVPSALLTSYLVVTSLATVRPLSWPWVDRVAMFMGATIGVGCLVLAAMAMARGGAARGMAYPLVMFGGVALAAAVGDRRMIRAGGVRGAARLWRHLWRMCFALFVASIAFYLGQGRVPEVIRTPALIAAGVLMPLAAMLYWRWRLRIGNSIRGVVRVDFVETT